MVNTKIFFFKLDDEYADYIFDISNGFSSFIYDDSTSDRVFVESSPTNKWEFDDEVVNGIFDDEQVLRVLTTEADEDLVCEDGETILIW